MRDNAGFYPVEQACLVRSPLCPSSRDEWTSACFRVQVPNFSALSTFFHWARRCVRLLILWRHDFASST